jgi:DNA-binding SARP family transcriptional activator
MAELPTGTITFLALLALRPGREVDRAWLVGTFWPASTETAAYANLCSSLKDLRQALGPEATRLRSPRPLLAPSVWS